MESTQQSARKILFTFTQINKSNYKGTFRISQNRFEATEERKIGESAFTFWGWTLLDK